MLPIIAKTLRNEPPLGLLPALVILGTLISYTGFDVLGETLVDLCTRQPKAKTYSGRSRQTEQHWHCLNELRDVGMAAPWVRDEHITTEFERATGDVLLGDDVSAEPNHVPGCRSCALGRGS